MSDKDPKEEIPESFLEAALREAQKDPVFKKLVSIVDSEISQHVRDGTMTEEEATAKILEMAKDPKLNAMIEAVAPSSQEGPDFFFQEDSSQLPQINPLLAGQMLERLQFDGDIPEFRGKGHMQEGALPAVPVDTMAVNPLVLGAQLEKASEEVLEEFEENIERLKPIVAEEVREAVEGQEEGALVETDEDFSILADVHSREEIDPEGYERGKVPALRKTEGPSASALVAYSPEKRQGLVWKSFSTTQGRRSSLKAIGAFLERKLREGGIDVVGVLPDVPSSDPVAMHTWTLSISGSKDTNSGFAPVAMAQAVLGARLLAEIPEDYRNSPLQLWVCTVDAYSERTVGWSAGLVPFRGDV